MNHTVEYAKAINPIKVNNLEIEFEDHTEHVSLVRSTTGNLPTILAKFVADKRALGTVLHSGIARAHRGNPAMGIRIQQVYGDPVLLSGLGAMVLNKNEVNMINQHHKEVIRNLQRLLPLTPQPFIYFLASTLPGTARVHLRQLSIFGMITRIPKSDFPVCGHKLTIFISKFENLLLIDFL